jgi:hypothetical protein
MQGREWALSRLTGGRSGLAISQTGSTIASVAVPGSAMPVVLPCRTERERWLTTSVFGIPGETQHLHLTMLSHGNVPPRVKAFPVLLFGDTVLAFCHGLWPTIVPNIARVFVALR